MNQSQSALADARSHPSPWPHRLAVALAVVTIPLISVGGLVTTYDAGMAVPDWPNTYGHNLFLYPWQTWLFGPWDLFIEHGHRLLGTVAGMLAIAVVVAVYRGDDRRWLLRFSLLVLAAVTAQGVLGGARVLLDERQLALVHGCVGPAFFGLCIALCVVTSRWWRSVDDAATDSPETAEAPAADRSSRLAGLTLAVVAAAYLQLVLGALLRHIPESGSPAYFGLIVWSHLVGAGIVTAVSLVVMWRLRRVRARASLGAAAVLLGGLLSLQIVLGCATWVVNYLWPTFVVRTAIAATYTLIESRGVLQSVIVTAHQANGTLILGTAVFLAVRYLRLVRSRRSELLPSTARLEGARV